ncbi:MAG: DNA-directed RNA polymerase subunit omega [Clostridia bacterium]|nr:DNA-directed RNA polymerase subunit omega [Clostridia bacterium]
MKFITHEKLKNEINEKLGKEMVVSKYELVMLIAKRANQLAIEVAAEEEGKVYEPDEKVVMRKTISEAISELEEGKLDVYKDVTND